MAVSQKKHIFRTFNVKTLTNSSEEIKVKDVMLCLCTILSLTAKTFLSAVKYSFILSINLLPEFVTESLKKFYPRYNAQRATMSSKLAKAKNT